MTHKLRSLEMLRALAALLVVLYHTETIFGRFRPAPFDGVFAGGSRGVDLFFVLSGFIIAYVHHGDLGQPRRLGRYLFNRATRIYPAVWIMTTFALLVYVTGFGGVGKATKLDVTAVVASFLLLAQHSAPLVNVTWTLTYEIFFYAVFAVAIINLRAGLILIVLWQAMAAILALSGAKLGLEGYYVRPICLEFSLGMGCAWWLMRAGQGRFLGACWGLLAAGVAAFVAGMALSSTFGWSSLFSALGAAAMIIALVRLEQAGRIQVHALLIRLGGASYAIYIVHYSVITLLAAVVVHRLHLPLADGLCLACALIAVLCGLAFDQVLDRPIQRALRGRMTRRATARSSAGAAALLVPVKQVV